jgi:hypothetical protein
MRFNYQGLNKRKRVIQWTSSPLTKTTSYFWAWIWAACTALIGVVASSLLVDKSRNKEAANA